MKKEGHLARNDQGKELVLPKVHLNFFGINHHTHQYSSSFALNPVRKCIIIRQQNHDNERVDMLPLYCLPLLQTLTTRKLSATTPIHRAPIGDLGRESPGQAGIQSR